MLRLVRTTAGLLLAFAAITSVAHAADSWWNPSDWGPMSYSFDSESQGVYVWRGWTLDDKTVYQPSFEMDYDPFSFNVYATYSARNTRGWCDATYVVAYTNTGKTIDWSVGHIWYRTFNQYHLPEAPAGLSNEFCFSVTAKSLPLYPTLTYFRDYDEGHGDYAQLTLTKVIPVRNSAPCMLTFDLGYNMGLYRPDSGFSNLETRLEVPIKLGKQGPFIFPTVSYSKSLDTTWYEDQFYAGVRMPWGG